MSLRDQHAAFQAARKRHDVAVPLFPKSQIAQDALDISRIRREAEEPAAESDSVAHAREHVGRQLLRHETDLRTGDAKIRDCVAAVDRDGARGRTHKSGDGADERRLSRAIRPQQRKNFARTNFEIYRFQCVKAAGVNLVQIGNDDDRARRPPFAKRATCDGGRSPS